jgi:chromosome segregation ATPase
MSWWHSDRRLLTNLTIKVDALLRANVAILQQVVIMSQVHDQILQLIRGLNEKIVKLHEEVTNLASEKIEGEQQFQDVTTALETAHSEVDSAQKAAESALKDNATQGGSTGGGSGAQANV